MSRHGYNDDGDYDVDHLSLYRWRGQVASAIRGRRGQAFLREMVEALDAMPVKVLIKGDLMEPPPAFIPPGAPPAVCAIGSVGLRRGVEMERMDSYDYDGIAVAFGIATPLVCEIEFMNDDGGHYDNDTPEHRWQRVRDWAVAQLKP